MQTRALEITARQKERPVSFASRSDFAVADGTAVDPQIIIANPDISLYCLDPENQQAIFVETTPGANLEQAPFYYYAQYEHAFRLYAVPLETFHRLAESVPLDSSRLLIIYSVGRSGSTLLSAAFGAAKSVTSLSEPDIYSQLVSLRAWDGSNGDEIRRLLDSSTRLLCKPSQHADPAAKWALKFRSFGIENGDHLFALYPDARHIFLYRDAESWAKSAFKAFGGTRIINESTLAQIQAGMAQNASLVAQAIEQNEGAMLSIGQLLGYMWLSVMDCYLKWAAQGVPMLAVRFQDFIGAPHQAIAAIFDYCAVPRPTPQLLNEVLETDSQAGTILSRNQVKERGTSVPDALFTDIAGVLQTHPTIRTPDMILPGTWQPGQ